MAEERVELRAKFIGRVQGVGFRFIAQQYAQKYKLAGSVKNLSDGSVEVIVQGNKDTIEKYLDVLKNEAFSDAIDEIQKSYSLPKEHLSSFTVIR